MPGPTRGHSSLQSFGQWVNNLEIHLEVSQREDLSPRLRLTAGSTKEGVARCLRVATGRTSVRPRCTLPSRAFTTATFYDRGPPTLSLAAALLALDMVTSHKPYLQTVMSEQSENPRLKPAGKGRLALAWAPCSFRF